MRITFYFLDGFRIRGELILAQQLAGREESITQDGAASFVNLGNPGYSLLVIHSQD